LKLGKPLNQQNIPIVDEPMVAVELQRVFFAIVRLLELVAGPARALGFLVGNINDGKMVVGKPFLRQRFLGAMLPRDTKVEILGKPGFRQTIPDSGNELWVAVRCNLDKNAHFFIIDKERNFILFYLPSSFRQSRAWLRT
jgi:hypothetical protein